MPGREEFWNIGYPLLGALVYILLVIAPAAVAVAIYRRLRVWRLGRPEPDLGPWGARIRRSLKLAAVDLLGHRRFVRGEPYAGLMHLFLFWGFLFLFIATSIGMLEFWFHKANPLGFDFPTARYRVQEDFIWDVLGGVPAFLGVTMALVRRYILRPARLNTFLDDHVILWSLLLLVVTGFVIEGLRVAGTDPRPAWAAPVGYLLSLPFDGAGDRAVGTAHAVVYWAHAGGTAALFLYLAAYFTKISHIFFSPLNALLRPARASGELRPMGDLATLERFGAADLPDLTWKQLLDVDACTNCGRCEDQCPAHASGKALSPRKLVQDLRSFATDRAPILIAAAKARAQPSPSHADLATHVDPEALWSCTTCAACVQACPAYIDPIGPIVDMRRNLVMERASMPATAMATLQSMEQRSHPWRGARFSRTDWFQGTAVRTMAEHPDARVLFWVGCTAALQERGQGVARAMASVLRRAGVDFAVLGAEEACTGDPARRLGNEHLFQVMAQRNIETMKRYGVVDIVTICPHCFNTMKNEYPRLGGVFKVQHYSQLLSQLIRDGQLEPRSTVKARVAYHDSCYLGRHNGVYDEPREIARSVPGLDLVEMAPRHRERGFCCGAGGGRVWMEESGRRVNHIRTEHFLETGADTVAVSCPFCLQMMDEGISSKGLQGTKRARDLVEILEESLTDADAGGPAPKDRESST